LAPSLREGNTLKVRLKIPRAGLDEEGNTFTQGAGEEIELKAPEAKRLLEAGQAEPVAKTKAKRAEKRTPPKGKKDAR
jgi:hypothetical protein